MPAKQEHQTITHPLSPLYQSDSKILILGSFPSVQTRAYGFFYGHPQNRFWPLMSALFGETLSNEIGERRDFLLRHQIAVYDSIYQCDIIGSSDASIQNVIPTDLSQVFQQSQIEQVFCNGATSYKYYQKYHTKQSQIAGMKLPSTSPANARFRLADLLEAWSVILPYLA
ncbi:DNA-deoxyinosine glycosylase [Ignavigranum ruoffiae]|uniref:DNA-deoxyinosine glycosylase n=1 Tax=Ignavigranum ruoffiae TaxID=89093 RepID=UPI0023541F7F|nr:DNA-deoxyinosine glycosylase [Ignavigranum ruoffiae]